MSKKFSFKPAKVLYAVASATIVFSGELATAQDCGFLSPSVGSNSNTGESRNSMNPYSTDNDGRTPLHIAAASGDTVFFNELIERYGNPSFNVTDVHQWTPLHFAAACRSKGVAALLLDNGANPYSTDNDGRTPLHIAAASGNKEFFDEFIKLYSNLNFNVADVHKWTPLHFAAASGSEGVAATLLDNGADPIASASDGWTPLHIAVASGSKEVAATLLDNGADPNALASDGWTPLELAVWKDNEDIENLLTP